MIDTTSRRQFLGASAGVALLCTLGGETVEVRAAKAGPPPRFVGGPQDFPTPVPAPGGIERVYWIQAVEAAWDIAPTGKDDWHGHKLPRKRTFRARVYREMTPGFGSAKGTPNMPGPTLYGEVGDVLVVHFRNRTREPITMHPHGVRYNPAYDGVYLGPDHTFQGGWIAPGQDFTYRWECTPDSVGAWPYHDHGPDHTMNTFRGLFGSLIVRGRGAAQPNVLYTLFMHQLPPNVTGLDANFQCFNGRAYAGNTPTLRSKVGQDVEINVFGMDNNFHDFHMHGHRWRDEAGAFVDTPSVGPNESTRVRFVEDNPGRWLYHCHVFSHQDMGMAGWYVVDP